MGTVERVIVLALGLILVYLLVVHSGGAGEVLKAIGDVSTRETTALQGR